MEANTEELVEEFQNFFIRNFDMAPDVSIRTIFCSPYTDVSQFEPSEEYVEAWYAFLRGIAGVPELRMAETFGNTPGLLNPIFQRPYPNLPRNPATQLVHPDITDTTNLLNNMRNLESEIQMLRQTTEQVFGMTRYQYDDTPRGHAYYYLSPDFWPPDERGSQ